MFWTHQWTNESKDCKGKNDQSQQSVLGSLIPMVATCQPGLHTSPTLKSVAFGQIPVWEFLADQRICCSARRASIYDNIGAFGRSFVDGNEAAVPTKTFLSPPVKTLSFPKVLAFFKIYYSHNIQSPWERTFFTPSFVVWGATTGEGDMKSTKQSNTKQTHIVLLNANDSSRLAGYEVVPSDGYKKKKKKKHSTSTNKAKESSHPTHGTAVTEEKEETKSRQTRPKPVRMNSAFCLPYEQDVKQQRVAYVRCPLGLESGNTLIVVSPANASHKFPIKVPKRVVCGQVFAVPIPDDDETCCSTTTQETEGSLDYCFRVVDEFLTPTPDNIRHPFDETNTSEETQDFTSFIDSFLTPVPEVKGFYHATSA